MSGLKLAPALLALESAAALPTGAATSCHWYFADALAPAAEPRSWTIVFFGTVCVAPALATGGTWTHAEPPPPEPDEHPEASARVIARTAVIGRVKRRMVPPRFVRASP